MSKPYDVTQRRRTPLHIWVRGRRSAATCRNRARSTNFDRASRFDDAKTRERNEPKSPACADDVKEVPGGGWANACTWPCKRLPCLIVFSCLSNLMKTQRISSGFSMKILSRDIFAGRLSENSHYAERRELAVNVKPFVRNAKSERVV